jgi:outer membrane protein TolC
MKHLSLSFATLVLLGLLAARAPAQPVQKQQSSHEIGGTLLSGSDRSGASADTGMSIDEFLREAIESNPGFRAARSRERSIVAQIPQVGAWDDPQAGVEFYATPISSINPLTEGMETDYFLQQMIPFPGKKGLMVNAAEAGAKMAAQSTRMAERTLIAETKRAFAMLYSAQRRVEVNEENQRLLDQIIASARSKYSVGVGNQSDVLKVQVELARLQNERAALDQEVTSGIAMLNALRNRPTNTAIGRVAEMPLDSLSSPIDSLTRLSLDARPELQGMKFEIQMNGSELSASKREWFPDLMLKGTYKQMRDQKDQWAAMIGINIPIAPWGIGKYSGKNEENEAKLKGSEESLLNMQNMVQSEVRNAYAKVQSRWQQIDRYRSHILPQAEQSLDASLASYRIDKVDFLSLLDSYRTLQMFRMEYYMTVGEYFISLASLEQAVGRDPR